MKKARYIGKMVIKEMVLPEVIQITGLTFEETQKKMQEYGKSFGSENIEAYEIKKVME